MNIPLPLTPEQDAITEGLDTHDARIRAEEAHCDKLKKLKKGLMHDLLTGRVRVKFNEESTA
jgi:type I restriction enzyme S subunit